MLTTNRAWSAVLKNTTHSVKVPPCCVSATLDNHGVLADAAVALRARQQSLYYGHLQLQPLYSFSSSLVSVGGGYRQFVHPRWTVGTHAHIDSGLLANNLGLYTKLSAGIEVQASEADFTLNIYCPNFLGYLNPAVETNKIEACSYAGHIATNKQVIERDQWGGDLQVTIRLWQGIYSRLAAYGISQKANQSILGGMIAAEYHWNRRFVLHSKYSFDNFYKHFLTLGVRIQGSHLLTHATQQRFWQPSRRHAAPLQTFAQRVEHREYHLFYDSLKGNEHNQATYEAPCQRLNNKTLAELRKAYPENIKKVVLHLRGTFSLEDGNQSVLFLDPNESIEGETASFDLKPPFIAVNLDELLRLSSLVHTKQLELLNRSNKEADKEKKGEETICLRELPQANISTHLIDQVIWLAEKKRLLDGRPHVVGTVSVNNGTSLRRIGFLPAVSSFNRGHIPALPSAVISSSDEKGSARIQGVSIQDVVISGFPDGAAFQYSYGINISHCDRLKMDSVWINNTKTAIRLSDVTQAPLVDRGKSSLQSIFTGSHHLSESPAKLDGFKEDLRKVLVQYKKGEEETQYKTRGTQKGPQSAYAVHKAMLANLAKADIQLRELFQYAYAEGFDSSKLSNERVTAQLDIEPYVFIGLEVSHGRAAKEKGFFNELTHTVTDYAAKLKQSFRPKPPSAVSANEKATEFNQEVTAKQLKAKKVANLAPINIGDSALMAQGVPLIVKEGFYVSVYRSLLNSHRLGGYIKESGLTWVGNLQQYNRTQQEGATWLEGNSIYSKDSFIYINSGIDLNLPFSTQREIDNRLIEIIGAELKAKLPIGLYIENNQSNSRDLKKRQVRVVNTNALMLVPSKHWPSMLEDKQEARDIKDNLAKAFFFCSATTNPNTLSITKDNVFAIIHPKLEESRLDATKVADVKSVKEKAVVTLPAVDQTDERVPPFHRETLALRQPRSDGPASRLSPQQLEMRERGVSLAAALLAESRLLVQDKGQSRIPVAESPRRLRSGSAPPASPVDKSGTQALNKVDWARKESLKDPTQFVQTPITALTTVSQPSIAGNKVTEALPGVTGHAGSAKIAPVNFSDTVFTQASAPVGDWGDKPELQDVLTYIHKNKIPEASLEELPPSMRSVYLQSKKTPR